MLMLFRIAMSQSSPTPLPLPHLPLGRYQHYKGYFYEVFGVAYHSETWVPHVVYRPLYGEGALWVRPYAMFVENVTVDGQVQPRFRHVPE